jgi:hypothetical protein
MVPAKISTGKRARVSWRIVGKQEVIGLFPNCPPSVQNAVFSGISVSALAILHQPKSWIYFLWPTKIKWSLLNP